MSGDCYDLAERVKVKRNLIEIREKIEKGYSSCCTSIKAKNQTALVAVSKTKPLDLIIACYEEGQRIFGENYPQELIQKAQNPTLVAACPEIEWRFIGNLQSNKAKGLVQKVVNLTVETVNSENLANDLGQAAQMKGVNVDVLVQVNTSEEHQKSGVSPAEALSLGDHIRQNCPRLTFRGFMTIGSLEQSLTADGENADFRLLYNTRQSFCDKFGLDVDEYELSMGMTNDMLTAIHMGSTSVRIGTAIFGAREAKK